MRLHMTEAEKAQFGECVEYVGGRVLGDTKILAGAVDVDHKGTCRYQIWRAEADEEQMVAPEYLRLAVIRPTRDMTLQFSCFQDSDLEPTIEARITKAMALASRLPKEE